MGPSYKVNLVIQGSPSSACRYWKRSALRNGMGLACETTSSPCHEWKVASLWELSDSGPGQRPVSAIIIIYDLDEEPILVFLMLWCSFLFPLIMLWGRRGWSIHSLSESLMIIMQVICLMFFSPTHCSGLWGYMLCTGTMSAYELSSEEACKTLGGRGLPLPHSASLCSQASLIFLTMVTWSIIYGVIL